MSSSNETKNWGTIFMGPGKLQEATLDSIESGTKKPLWDEKTEADYMARVQARATDKVREMLDAAREEAEALRTAAREEGYRQGLEDAQHELEDFRAGMGDSVAAVLQAIQGQCSTIFDAWRADLVGVLHAAVERSVGIALDADRKAIMETLFVQAVQALETRTNLVIRVSPEDEPAVADMIAAAQSRLQGLEAWMVRPDTSVGPGGLIVEGAGGMVDNRVETRRAVINEVLAHLTLPGDHA